LLNGILPGQKVDNATRERYLKLCNGLTATPLPIPFVFLGDQIVFPPFDVCGCHPPVRNVPS